MYYNWKIIKYKDLFVTFDNFFILNFSYFYIYNYIILLYLL